MYSASDYSCIRDVQECVLIDQGQEKQLLEKPQCAASARASVVSLRRPCKCAVVTAHSKGICCSQARPGPNPNPSNEP